MKNLVKIFLSRIKQIVFSQNIIEGKLFVGKDASISSLRLLGSLYLGEGAIIKEVNLTGDLKIGRFTTLWGPNINMYGHISIGSFCSIANNVSFFEKTHNYQRLTTYFINKNYFKEGNDDFISKGEIKIGSDVWIGSGVSILSGVEIGHGVVIAAHSVVNSDLPPYSICAGTPAKVIGFRFDDLTIKELLKLKWWEWGDEKLKENISLFNGEFSIEMLRAESIKATI